MPSDLVNPSMLVGIAGDGISEEGRDLLYEVVWATQTGLTGEYAGLVRLNIGDDG